MLFIQRYATKFIRNLLKRNIHCTNISLLACWLALNLLRRHLLEFSKVFPRCLFFKYTWCLCIILHFCSYSNILRNVGVKINAIYTDKCCIRIFTTTVLVYYTIFLKVAIIILIITSNGVIVLNKIYLLVYFVELLEGVLLVFTVIETILVLVILLNSNDFTCINNRFALLLIEFMAEYKSNTTNFNGALCCCRFIIVLTFIDSI